MDIRAVALLVLAGALTGCGDATGPDADFYKGLALVQTFNPIYPVLAVDQSGNSLILRQEGGVITGGVFRRSNGEQMTMEMGPDGRPSRVIVGGYILLFENYDGDKVDVGIIGPGGEIEVVRGARFGSFPLAAQAFAMADGSAGGSAAGVAASYRFASLSWSWFVCGVSVMATAGTGGVLAGLPYFACGAAVIKTAATLVPSDDPGLEATADAISLVGSTVGCAGGDPLSCIDQFVAAAALGWSIGEAVARDLEDELHVTQSALENGGGDVQITLTWATTADLDLWVTGPDGDRIYFLDRTSPTGGQLDRDDTNGFGPENIFWPTGQAPTGEYLVQVDHYGGASPSSYTVLIQVFGRVKAYNGTIRTNETLTIARLRTGQPLPVGTPVKVVAPHQSVAKGGVTPGPRSG